MECIIGHSWGTQFVFRMKIFKISFTNTMVLFEKIRCSLYKHLFAIFGVNVNNNRNPTKCVLPNLQLVKLFIFKPFINIIELKWIQWLLDGLSSILLMIVIQFNLIVWSYRGPFFRLLQRVLAFCWGFFACPICLSV